MTKNQETIDEIMRLRESGMKVQDIADHFGVSKERIYQIAGDELKTWQKDNNAPPPKPKRKADIRSIRRMMAEGHSMADIAKKYGVSRQAIYQRVKEDEARKAGIQFNGYGVVREVGQGEHRLVDPKTGLVIENRGHNSEIIGRMGDERVTAFVEYHMELLAMRQGVDKRDVQDLYNRFYRYLNYCREHGIIPNNANAYLAIGLTRSEVSAWRRGVNGTPEHKQFAEDIHAFFASIHEQGSTDGVLNPISAMFWQKAYDGLVEASKLEVTAEDPLGQKRSAEEIAKAYSGIDLPDD